MCMARINNTTMFVQGYASFFFKRLLIYHGVFFLKYIEAVHKVVLAFHNRNVSKQNDELFTF